MSTNRMQTQENEVAAKDLYVASVTTLGGRNSHAQSSDNLLSVNLAFPKLWCAYSNATQGNMPTTYQLKQVNLSTQIQP